MNLTLKRNPTSDGKETSIKIIWAIDPFTGNQTLLYSAASLIQSLMQKTLGTVEPVYIFSPQSIEVPFESPEGLLNELQATGQKAVDQILKKIKVSHIRPLKVLLCPALTTKERINGLLQYAKEIGAETLVASTHARKGVKRWVLGSFAETLATHSDLPVFLVNPSWNHRMNFKNILFPTDFSEVSEEAFSKVIERAQILKSKIILYHKLQYELTPELSAIVQNYPAFEKAYNEDLEDKRKKMQLWVKKARDCGISSKAVLRDRYSEQGVEEEILSFANIYNAIIAMASQSGPWSAALLGSITRKIMRVSTHPIWIIHPMHKKEKKDQPHDEKPPKTALSMAQAG